MRTSILIFLSIILLSSCREKIDFDLNSSNTRIVIDGNITSEYKRHLVKISKTSSYYDTEPGAKVTDAFVTISDGTNTFILSEEEPGMYYTDSLSGEVGKTYTLEVNYEGTTYSGQSTLLEVAPVNGIIVVQPFDTIPIINEVDSDYVIAISIDEPAGLGDYYLFKYFINGTLESDTVLEYSFVDDTFIDGVTFDTLGINITPVYYVDHKDLEVGDVVKLDVMSIDKSYNDYLISVLIQSEFQGGLFSGPAANVKGNLSNGALGYFYASDVSSAETIVFQ